MKNFTVSDIKFYGKNFYGMIRNVCKEDLIHEPLWFHKKNLMQTATGYGKKLKSEWKIRYNNRMRRIYYSISSNSGTFYILSNGKRVIIDICG